MRGGGLEKEMGRGREGGWRKEGRGRGRGRVDGRVGELRGGWRRRRKGEEVGEGERKREEEEREWGGGTRGGVGDWSEESKRTGRIGCRVEDGRGG